MFDIIMSRRYIPNGIQEMDQTSIICMTTVRSV